MSCASSDTLVPSADSHEVSTAEIQRIKDIVRDVRSWMSNDKGAQTFTFLDFSKAGRDLLEIRLIEDGLRLQSVYSPHLKGPMLKLPLDSTGHLHQRGWTLERTMTCMECTMIGFAGLSQSFNTRSRNMKSGWVSPPSFVWVVV